MVHIYLYRTEFVTQHSVDETVQSYDFDIGNISKESLQEVNLFVCFVSFRFCSISKEKIMETGVSKNGLSVLI